MAKDSKIGPTTWQTDTKPPWLKQDTIGIEQAEIIISQQASLKPHFDFCMKRLAEGYPTYGDEGFHKTIEQTKKDIKEELADVVNYALMQMDRIRRMGDIDGV